MSLQIFGGAQKAFEFEMGLKRGDVVEAHWTNGDEAITAFGTIQKIDRRVIHLRLRHSVSTSNGSNYAKGAHVAVPTILAIGWSLNNRVAPVRRKANP